MRIVVLIKGSPDPAGGDRSWRPGETDAHALELALRLGERTGEVSIDVLGAGPVEAEGALKRAVGMGAGRAWLVECSAPPANPLVAARLLAAAAGRIGFDLLLAGARSDDGQHGVTGQLVAGLLGLPCAAFALAFGVEPAAGLVEVEREMEGGWRERRALALPCLVTVQSSRAAPRYPTLSDLMRADRQGVGRMEIDREPPPTHPLVVRSVWPERTRPCRQLTGSREMQAATLAGLLRERGLT